MEIEIVFQTWDGEGPVRLRPSPEEYFDPIGPNETYEDDAIAKYNHTWEYLDVPREQLKWTTERRVGTSHDRMIITQYMDDGRSWMTHRVDPDGYEELIHYTQLDSRTYHLIRTVKHVIAGPWAVHVNSLTVDDDLMKAKSFQQPWTYEGVKNYCGLPRIFNTGEDEQQAE